jgi:tetratricopeptide (TPR) repeat protein
MLGNLSFLNNPFFLSVRWFAAIFWLFAPALNGQTALRSQNFIFYSAAASLQLVEQGLFRLEHLRAAIQAIHGADWVASSPLRLWLPRKEADWLKLVDNKLEQGQFLSGPRHDWIIANPAAPNFLEVLSHEYIHAVLHQKLPNLPTWFEEGICEYYSTLALRNKGHSTELILGLTPTRHKGPLSRLKSLTIPTLENQPPTASDYALYWALAYHLWPTWQPTTPFPTTIAINKFPVRIRTVDLLNPNSTTATLTPQEIKEIQIEFHNQFPAWNPATLGPDDAAEPTFLEGLRLSDSGQHKDAIPKLERACQLRPSSSSCWYALGFAYSEANQPTEARQALQRAISTAANDTERTSAQTLLNSLRKLP